MMELENLSGVNLDEYRLDNLIGRGGMSAVYQAYQEELDRKVAIKVLSGELLAEPGYLQRFDREAKLAASLEHPHIVPIYDYGVHDNLSYVVMRLLTGGTLLEHIRGGALAPKKVGEILAALGKALDYGHSRGVIHRDIKPGNIMFDAQDTVYLVDFGIAKATQQTDLSLTAPNVVMGTPSYIAPEQWRAEDISPAVDQYALAVVVYRALTQELPFTAETPHALMYKHINDAPTPVHTINSVLSPAISDVLDKALSKNPSQRFTSVTAFSRAFNEALTQPVPTDTAAAAVPELSEPTLMNANLQDMPFNLSQQSDPEPEPEPEKVPAPIPQPVPSTPGENNYAVQPQPDMGPGDKTIMMQIASGGAVGLIMMFAVIAIGAAIVLFLLNPGDTTDDTINNNDDDTTIVQITQEAVASGGGIEPTLTPLFGAVLQNTPAVSYTGMTPANLRETRVLFSQPTTPVNDAVFSPDNTMLAAGNGNSVLLWRNGAGTDATLLRGHTNVVTSVEFSPDGAFLLSGSRDTSARLWNTATGELVLTLNAHIDAIRDVSFSPDGQRVATAAEDNSIKVWDLQSSQAILTINETARVMTVDFSPDGAVLASGARNGVVKLWNTETGGLQANLSGHNGEIRGVEFSPDGALLASSSLDDEIRLWDVSARRTIQTLRGHNNDVWVVAFNADGTLLASGGRSNDLRVWDVASGNQLKVLNGHAGWVLGVDFSADGSSIITGSGDGSARLWQSP
ncbi:MAG: WD40 repeat domain-containing serine/threonine protein kinase [Aggregatilineales bacterium]